MQHEKVLVIDDDINSGKALKWAMEASGHEVRFVDNGEKALAEIADFVPDVVLCDINMPRIKGYEVCKRMKADPRLNNTLFIAQTGLSSYESQQLSRQAGFAHHLIKPIDINRLFELVFLERAALHGFDARVG